MRHTTQANKNGDLPVNLTLILVIYCWIILIFNSLDNLSHYLSLVLVGTWNFAPTLLHYLTSSTSKRGHLSDWLCPVQGGQLLPLRWAPLNRVDNKVISTSHLVRHFPKANIFCIFLGLT